MRPRLRLCCSFVEFMFLRLTVEFEGRKKEFLVEDSFLVEWRVEFFDGRHHDRPLSLFLLQLKHRSLKIGWKRLKNVENHEKWLKNPKIVKKAKNGWFLPKLSQKSTVFYFTRFSCSYMTTAWWHNVLIFNFKTLFFKLFGYVCDRW